MSFSALREWSGKKASNRLVLFFFFISSVLVPIITHGPEWIKLWVEKPPPPTLGDATNSKDKPVPREDIEPCLDLTALEKLEIEVEYEKIRKKGDFYSPTGVGESWEGTVWIKDKLKPNFKKIFIEYEIISEKNPDKPPSFIWTISRVTSDGERQHIGKLWLPEFSKAGEIMIPQLVGFAKTTDFDNGTLRRETSLELSDPAKFGKLDSLTIEKTGISGNEMMINFTYSYTSDRNGVAMSFPFTKKITFPFSNLASSGEQLEFGIGTFIGYSLRIISLKVCY